MKIELRELEHFARFVARIVYPPSAAARQAFGTFVSIVAAVQRRRKYQPLVWLSRLPYPS